MSDGMERREIGGLAVILPTPTVALLFFLFSNIPIFAKDARCGGGGGGDGALLNAPGTALSVAASKGPVVMDLFLAVSVRGSPDNPCSPRAAGV